jgi:two-component system, NarL family, invasion response regulator UvrY
MVADDSPAFLRAAVEVVRRAEGFELAGVARSGLEAVELAAEVAPDLVLMDVRMPGGGGIDAARRIAALPSRTVVVLISDWPENFSTHPERTCGAAAAVRKQLLLPGLLAELWQEHGAAAGPQPAPV